jgi:WD40 repeat protein
MRRGVLVDPLERVHGGACRREQLVISASFIHDGIRILTASDDGTARLWDSVPQRQRERATGSSAR